MNTLLRIFSWLPFALFASAVWLCIGIFQSLRRESRTVNEQNEAKSIARDLALQAVQAELEAVKRGLREAEERAGLLVPPTPPRSGLNLNKRTQALRMSRLGENAENIAAALSLPRREIELLLKIQRIVITSSDYPTS